MYNYNSSTLITQNAITFLPSLKIMSKETDWVVFMLVCCYISCQAEINNSSKGICVHTFTGFNSRSDSYTCSVVNLPSWNRSGSRGGGSLILHKCSVCCLTLHNKFSLWWSKYDISVLISHGYERVRYVYSTTKVPPTPIF